MNYKHILLCTLLAPISFITHGQEPNEQRIRELKSTWCKIAEEFSELGKNIFEKEYILASLRKEQTLLVEELATALQTDTETIKQKAYSIAKNFINNLKHKPDIKAVFFKELVDNIGNGIIPKEKFSMKYDKIKLITIMLNIQETLLQELISACGECVKKMTELEYELTTLGAIDYQ